MAELFQYPVSDGEQESRAHRVYGEQMIRMLKARLNLHVHSILCSLFLKKMSFANSPLLEFMVRVGCYRFTSPTSMAEDTPNP